MKKSYLPYLFTLIFGISSVQAAGAAQIDWVDWTSAPAGAAVVNGTLSDGNAVTYTGNYAFAQLGTGINYWTEPSAGQEPYTGNSVIDNAPTPAEMIALNVAATHKIEFSAAVIDPVLAIVSMGQPNLPVTYSFNSEFNLLSNGVGYWSFANGGNPGSYSIVGNSLTGNELHAAIQFTGSFTSIEWTSSPNEYWHGITVGTPAPVPEPASILLLTTGILGLAGFKMRFKKIIF